MSANITVDSITWNATPAGNQTCTVRYRPWGSEGAWTVVTAAQVIHPDGVLAPVAVIGGLDEGTDYEVQVKNNAGAVAFSKKITTAAVNDTLTFFNKMAAGSIDSIRLDDGANILSGPIAAGENFPYSAPALYGNHHLIEITLGLDTPTKVYFILKDSEIDLDGEYAAPTDGAEFDAWDAVVPVGKDFYIRDADYHTKTSQYTVSRGGMHGSCAIGSPAGFVQRTQSAANDSVNAAATITPHITWTPDNDAATVDETYTLAPGALTVPVPALEISVAPCTDVAGEITSLAVS